MDLPGVCCNMASPANVSPPGSVAPALSIVIPALDEARSLPGLLADLRALERPHEIIVVDGGSSDATPDIARDAGARVVTAPRGRGTQLAIGAGVARAQVLCFIHADVRLSPAAIRAMERALDGALEGAYAFRLRIGAAGMGYRIVELGANARSILFRLPYGDQGLLLHRDLYDAAGGYLPLPLMEDVTLVRAIARVAPVRLLGASITVSPRRWRREGLVRATLRNWSLMAAWLLGAAPERLASRYTSERSEAGAG